MHRRGDVRGQSRVTNQVENLIPDPIPVLAECR
jgi:hypothetical protein